MNRRERRRKAKVNRTDLPKTESQVVVRLMESKSVAIPPDMRRFIRVELYSHRSTVTGRLKSQSDIYPHECGGEREFEQKIEAVAGTMAENQCEMYNDNHDPSEVARLAKEAYRELRSDMTRVYTPPPQE